MHAQFLLIYGDSQLSGGGLDRGGFTLTHHRRDNNSGVYEYEHAELPDSQALAEAIGAFIRHPDARPADDGAVLALAVSLYDTVTALRQQGHADLNDGVALFDWTMRHAKAFETWARREVDWRDYSECFHYDMSNFGTAYLQVRGASRFDLEEPALSPESCRAIAEQLGLPLGHVAFHFPPYPALPSASNTAPSPIPVVIAPPRPDPAPAASTPMDPITEWLQVTVFAAAHSLYKAAELKLKAQGRSSSDAFGDGGMEFLHWAWTTAGDFIRWADNHVDFDSCKDVFTYDMEDHFGGACMTLFDVGDDIGTSPGTDPAATEHHYLGLANLLDLPLKANE